MNHTCDFGLSNVRSIAILRPSAVGDFVFSLPALHALRRRYPEAEIVYIGRQWHVDFLADRPCPVDECVVMPPWPGISLPADAVVDPMPVKRFIEWMRDARFDIAMQMYGGGRHSNPLVQQFGARLTAGMRAEDAVPLDRWISFRSLQNRRLQLLEVASLVGAGEVYMERELTVTEHDRRQTEHVVPGNLSERLVVLQPGASDPRRRWPAECFAKVGDVLAGEGAIIAVNGTDEEAAVVHEVIGRMRNPAVDLTGKLSLSGLCGLLDRASLMISNDTGPLHLALAIGTPSVGIYWLTNVFESGPLRQHLHRPAVSMRIHCPVCGIENLNVRCAHEASFVDTVTVREVIERALDLLAVAGARLGSSDR